MSNALADESGQLVIELHAAISDLDPARWRVDGAHALRTRLEDIHARLRGLTDRRWSDDTSAIYSRLAELDSTLEAELVDDLVDPGPSMRQRWMALRSRLVTSYEALQATLREHEIHVPSLRPTNYTRSLFHVFNATLTITILWLLPEPGWGIAVAVPVALAGWTMELSRRFSPKVNERLMVLFGPVAHPHERRRVNSATWYVTALGLLSLTQAPLIAAVGLAALGLGDPTAALIGRRFGKHKLLHGRTVEGTLAFVVAGTLAGLVAALAFQPSLSLPLALAIASAGAVAGAFAELLSLRVDDNLSIPISAAAAAALASLLLGVPL